MTWLGPSTVTGRHHALASVRPERHIPILVRLGPAAAPGELTLTLTLSLTPEALVPCGPWLPGLVVATVVGPAPSATMGGRQQLQGVGGLDERCLSTSAWVVLGVFFLHESPVSPSSQGCLLACEPYALPTASFDCG